VQEVVNDKLFNAEQLLGLIIDKIRADNADKKVCTDEIA
jgi:hypothetical protein